jgi:hypothetical protein
VPSGVRFYDVIADDDHGTMRRWLVATSCAVALAAGAAATTRSLRFRWEDGTRLAVHGRTYVWCGSWDDGTRIQTLRIQQSSPFSPPWWFLEVRLKLARKGRRIVFPVLSGRSAEMFVAYPAKGLEASTASERSRGSLAILGNNSCRPGSRVSVSVRATLASEEAGGPSIDVAGLLVGSIEGVPAPGVQP